MLSWGQEPAKGITFVAPGDREKEKGNALFKEGKFEAALISYRNGLEAVRKDVTAHGVSARLALHLNSAAALLKLERPRDAVQEATNALALDARNLKALLRRARAHVGLGNLAAAKTDISLAASLRPEDNDVLSMQQHIVQVESLSFTAAIQQLMKGELADALALLRTVIDTAEAVGAIHIAAHGYSYMGIALQKQGNIPEAITCHERHLSLAEGLASNAERLRALSNLSSAHQLNGGYVQAIEYHTQQAELITDATPPEDLCALYGNMSGAYQSAGQLEKALHYQELCLKVATDLDNRAMRAKALGNLGQILSALGRRWPTAASRACVGMSLHRH